jgi:hypothetical protein
MAAASVPLASPPTAKWRRICRAHRRRILHVLGGFLVERAAQRVERIRRDRVAVERERQCRRRALERDFGVVERMVLVATLGEFVVAGVERVGEDQLLDNLVVARLADIALSGHRVGGHAFERESRFE